MFADDLMKVCVHVAATLGELNVCCCLLFVSLCHHHHLHALTLMYNVTMSHLLSIS